MKPIIEKRRENLFQVSCLRLFEATHKNGVSENVGNHPNAYFNSSHEYIKAVSRKEQKKVPNEPKNTNEEMQIVT